MLALSRSQCGIRARKSSIYSPRVIAKPPLSPCVENPQFGMYLYNRLRARAKRIALGSAVRINPDPQFGPRGIEHTGKPKVNPVKIRETPEAPKRLGRFRFYGPPTGGQFVALALGLIDLRGTAGGFGTGAISAVAAAWATGALA